MKKIKKTYLIKMLATCCIIMLGTSIVPLHAKSTQKEFEQSKSISISVFECNSGKVIKTQKIVTEEQANNLLKILLNSEITKDNYYEKIEEKINIMENENIISPRATSSVLKSISNHQKFLQKRTILPTPRTYFDAANIINVVFFGLKGERDINFLEISLLQLPFLNGTIVPQFTLLNRFMGNGSIFSLGLLGFKYSYGFDTETYPEFPHFPEIMGGNLAFTGILIDVTTDNDEYAGHYFIGVGMSFITIWNKVE